MALTFEYRNEKSDSLAFFDLHHRKTYRAYRAAHFQSIFYWSVVTGMAIYAAYQAENILLGFIFAAVLLILLYQSIPYRRIYRQSVEQSCPFKDDKIIRLVVDDDGLHETVNEIESFAPWRAIRSYVFFDDILFIELADDRWAIIPRHSQMLRTASLDDLVRVLNQNGIQESPASKWE